jgi:Protein of unknown function (DUF2946)
MDTQVLAAMAKWPNVPSVKGWLRLDKRGNWFLIDRGAPGFDEIVHGRGSPITSPPIRDFIERNYTCNEQGEWFWQNGPQRVFVDYEVAPLVLRVMSSKADTTQKSLMTNCGDLVREILAVHTDEDGHVLIKTEFGLGVVHDMDAAQLSISEIEQGTVHSLVLEWQNIKYTISLAEAT